MNLQKSDIVVLGGYGKDRLARLVEVLDIDKDYLKVKCLLRSTLIKPVYRTYKINKIRGYKKTILEEV